MAKGKKKSVTNNYEKGSTSIEDNVFNIITIIFIVFVVLSLFYLITLLIVGDSSKKEKPVVNFEYKEILAGTSFDKKDEEYFVVYYDFTDSNLEDLYYSINEYESQHKSNKIYLVNMNEGLNKKYIASKDSNKTPNNINDLSIKGPTLIHFKDKKVTSYIEGKDDIVSYLK